MIGFGFKEIVLSAGAPLGRKKNITIKTIATITASAINIYCQLNLLTIKLPIVGASKGERPTTKISSEIIEALFSGGNKSCTKVIAATDATHPLNACINLNSNNISIEVDVAQLSVAIMYKIKPIYNGGFLPKRSSNGPYKICPSEKPKK